MSFRRGVFVLILVACAGALVPISASLGVSVAERTDLTPTDLARVRAVTRATEDFSKPEKFEEMQGGAGTTRKLVNRDSFSQSAANIGFAGEDRFKLGNALFRKLWVASPSSTAASDGLGPLFNSRSCQSCHLKDGRGHPPLQGEDATSMFLRLSRPPQTPEERQALATKALLRIPDPIYGGQLQSFAVPGHKPEGQMRIAYRDKPVTLGDGTVVVLRDPTYSADLLGYGSLDPHTILSPRNSPPMIGLGLLEAIPAEDIAARSDPQDTNGDGISGRVNQVKDPETGAIVLGRFGWKATAPSIRVQTADAFSSDIGISTPLDTNSFGECTSGQAACREAPNGVQERLGSVEAPDPVLDLVTFYSQNLAVPARRDVDAPDVLRGKQLFYEAGCPACHTPKFVTSRETPDKHRAFQLIWPYTDMLLHDMGDGLADGSTVGDAGPNEWRTPPLWGIGLTQTVSGHTLFLHDGRARNLTEAILWHGGEGQRARDAFADLPAADRDAILRFLESL